MINLLSKIGRLFFDADKGGGGGASGGGGSSGGGAGGTSAGEGNAGGGDELDIKLFEGLPWDELDDDTQAALKKIQAGAVATLQSNKNLSGKLLVSDKLVRQFQSETDRLKAEKEKQVEKPTDPYLTAVAEELRSAGYTPEDSTRLAPVFANMFKKVGAIQKEELGKSLAPMAASVLSSQAQEAFFQAQRMDVLGMFQTPEVSQVVWNFVRERVKQGAETTPDIVLNLAKMAWADQQAKAKTGGELTTTGILPENPPNMVTGGFGGGMAGMFSPTAAHAPDKNAAKTVLNDDTRNALASSFKVMLAGSSIMPTELKDILKPKKGGK